MARARSTKTGKRSGKAQKSALPTAALQYPLTFEAEQYARDVAGGKVDTCSYVRLACERFLSDLCVSETGDGQWRFERELSEARIAFIQNLPHTKGKWAARHELTILSAWQKFIVAQVFGWVDRETGLRRFREVYLEIPRKNGKSHLAACIGITMFVADGEFGAEVFSGATTEKQAWEIFRPARLIMLRTPGLAEEFGVQVNAASMVLEDGSRFQPVIGDPGDGASPSCSLIDEYHEHKTASLYETMETGMGSRDQPLNLIVTTAGVDLAGPCYSKRTESVKMLEGMIPNDRLFALIYTLDKDDDWTTLAALKKANPNFGVSVNEDYLVSRQKSAIASATKQNSFRTKHLNQWVGARTAWMNMEEWRKRSPKRKSLEELRGRPCYVGYDLASKTDMAAMVLVFPPYEDDPLYHIHGFYFLPENKVQNPEQEGTTLHYVAWNKEGRLILTPGDAIDYDFIEEETEKVRKNYDVLEMPCDPYNAMQFMTRQTKIGAPIVEFGPTVKNFSEPMKQVEALVKKGLLAHGDCPIMAWCISNVVARLDAKDNIFPVKEADDNKIDGAVALIAGIGRAMVSGGAGGEKSFWETAEAA